MIVSRIALNLLKQETSQQVKITARRKKAGKDNNYLLKVLTADCHFKIKKISINEKFLSAIAMNHSFF